MIDIIELIRQRIIALTSLPEIAVGWDCISDNPGPAIGVFLYAPRPNASYPLGKWSLQIQCRDEEPDKSYALAESLSRKIPSKMETGMTAIGEHLVFISLKSGARKLKTDGSGRSVYHFEITVIGKN